MPMVRSALTDTGGRVSLVIEGFDLWRTCDPVRHRAEALTLRVNGRSAGTISVAHEPGAHGRVLAELPLAGVTAALGPAASTGAVLGRPVRISLALSDEEASFTGEAVLQLPSRWRLQTGALFLLTGSGAVLSVWLGYRFARQWQREAQGKALNFAL